jgi:RHS repeat-associated protein
MSEYNLINMNGRVYDPWLGRMLSPDPILQAPSNSQNYNRYTYAMNNPLKYTDPSGYYNEDAPWETTGLSGNPTLANIRSNTAHGLNAANGTTYGSYTYKNGKYVNTWSGQEASWQKAQSQTLRRQAAMETGFSALSGFLTLGVNENGKNVIAGYDDLSGHEYYTENVFYSEMFTWFFDEPGKINNHTLSSVSGSTTESSVWTKFNVSGYLGEFSVKGYSNVKKGKGSPNIISRNGNYYGTEIRNPVLHINSTALADGQFSISGDLGNISLSIFSKGDFSIKVGLPSSTSNVSTGNLIYVDPNWNNIIESSRSSSFVSVAALLLLPIGL